ncbi:msr-110 isoform 2-T4 [Cochliomyia hominivorax]
MTEKDTASMTTVQMKADYAASEVYSTASEPPPAYKRQSNSVKIAKITAFTIIVSSFILGAFILASSYLQAKASCDQVQALDSVLEKELMLETLQQVNKELPRAEALLGREHNNDDDLQNLDKEEPVKKVEHKMVKAEHKPSEEETNMNENNENENSEEAEEMQKYPGKIPLELDLSDLAAALLQNNKKSRMNCVVERKHAEEIVDSPSKTVSLPFGMNLTTDPKKARITGERISIFCEGGNENKEQESARNNNREEDDDEIDDVEAIRPMFIPFQRVPIPFGAIPNRFPLTHMPQRMEPPMIAQRQPEQQHGFLRQMPPPPPPFQQLPMRPPMPPQEMQAPHPEPQRIVRIQFHQIPIREMIHMTSNEVPQQMSVQQHQQPSTPVQHQQPPQQQQPQPQVQVQQQQQQTQPQQRPEFPFFQIQRMPLGLALERAGITAEDLNNIQRLTENRINEEIRLFANDSDEDETSNSSEDDDDNDDTETSAANAAQQNKQQQQQQNQPQEEQQSEQQHQQQAERQARMQELPMPIQRLILQPLPEQPRDTMTPPMPDQPMQRLTMGHPGWGRSLAQPVSIPVPMMETQQDMSAQDEQSSAQTAEESERPHFVQPRSV